MSIGKILKRKETHDSYDRGQYGDYVNNTGKQYLA